MQRVYHAFTLVLAAVAAVIVVLFGPFASHNTPEPKLDAKTVTVQPNQILTAPEAPVLLKVCQRSHRPPCHVTEHKTEEP